MLSIGTSNCELHFTMLLPVSVLMQIVLVLLRLWVLWDRRTRLVLSTLILFVLTQVTSVVCTAYVVSALMRESLELSVGALTGLWCVAVMVFNPILHTCMLTKKVNFVILWTPGVVSIQL